MRLRTSGISENISQPESTGWVPWLLASCLSCYISFAHRSPFFLAAILTLNTTDILFCKKECYNKRETWMFWKKSMINEVKFRDFMSLLFKINEACCINKWLHSFMYVLVIFTWNIINISKNTPEWQNVVRVRKLESEHTLNW